MNEEHNYSFVEILRTILRRRKLLIIISIVTIIASSTIAMLLPVYYKSQAIFIPFDPKSYDPKFLGETDFEVFGTNSDVERSISTGYSSEVLNHIIRKFDLVKRYEIDTTSMFYMNQTFEKLMKNFLITKSQFGGVEVTVFDQDRNVAADIANETVRKIDALNRIPIIDNNQKLFKIRKKTLENKIKILDSLNQIQKETGIGKSSLIEQIGETQAELLETNAGIDLLSQPFQTLHVIETASPAEKKSKPVRWVIVVSSFIIIFILSCLYILISEYYKKELKDFI